MEATEQSDFTSGTGIPFRNGKAYLLRWGHLSSEFRVGTASSAQLLLYEDSVLYMGYFMYVM